MEVILEFHGTPFIESPSGDLFVLFDGGGSPITLWKIDPEMREDLASHASAITPPEFPDAADVNPLQFVGALRGQYHGRMRTILAGSNSLFLLGNMGVIALPNSEL